MSKRTEFYHYLLNSGKLDENDIAKLIETFPQLERLRYAITGETMTSAAGLLDKQAGTLFHNLPKLGMLLRSFLVGNRSQAYVQTQIENLLETPRERRRVTEVAES